MRKLGLLLLALAAGVASAADNDARIAALANPPARNWEAVDAISAAAEKAPKATLAGRYGGDMQDLLLAPDGRMVTVFNAAARAQMEEHGGMSRGMATIGHWSQDGDWLVLVAEDYALAPAAAPPTAEAIAAFREQLVEFYGDMSEDEALDAYEAMMKQMEADGGARTRAAFGGEAEDNRLLVVENADGVLLLDGNFLLMQAQQWSGDGPLDVSASYWRAAGAQSAYAQPRQAGASFKLADPLHASVPLPLRSLLRPQVIEARVLGLVDEDKPLDWNSNNAQVRLRLDRGADDGLLADMWMHGVPPHESVFSKIESVSAKESVLLVNLTRFAPGDAPAIPPKGVVLASRTMRAIGCGIDSRAAVRAKVTAVRAPPGGVTRNDDGFAYVELEIDQGAHHGLVLEDEFAFEGDVAGEGRVRRLGETTATVLWRSERQWTVETARAQAARIEDPAERKAYLDRYETLLEADPPGPVVLPAAGQHLVTPSWQSAERDVFGKALGDTAPSSPLLVD